MGWKLPVLTTERLLLRAVTLADAEAMFKYCSNDNVSRYVLWDTHQTLEDTKSFIEMAMDAYEMREFYHWGIEYNSQLIGTIDFVGINEYGGMGEVGYVLAEEYWNKGFVTEATKKIIDYGFDELGFVRIQARCIAENTASARVMEKTGMKFEGTLRKSMLVKGTHRDINMYAIIDEDR